MKTKNIILIFITLTLVVGTAYFASKKSATNPAIQEQSVTYENSFLGISLKYPESWKSQEYKFGDEVIAIAFDPENTESQETFESIDAPLGLVSIYLEKKIPGGGDIRSTVGYESFEKVMIGESGIIEARKSTKILDESIPNPAYVNKHSITYFIHRESILLPDMTIRYLSSKDDPFIDEFSKIINSLKFSN